MKLFFTTVFISFAMLSWALSPSKTYKQRPERYNIKYSEVKVKTEDGSLLNLWYFPTLNPSDNLMLIAHNGEGNMADYLRRVDQFKRLGYNVVTFDYRGFGESSDFEIREDMFIYAEFITDLEAIIGYCRDTLQETFEMYGFGIGAGLALGVGYQKPEIIRIIADTPFVSLEDVEEKYDQQRHWMELPFDDFPESMEPIHAVSKMSGKNLKGVLILIGSNDALFRKSDMEKIRQRNVKLISQIAVIDNPSRMDNFKTNKEKYFNEIIDFLEMTK